MEIYCVGGVFEDKSSRGRGRERENPGWALYSVFAEKSPTVLENGQRTMLIMEKSTHAFLEMRVGRTKGAGSLPSWLKVGRQVHDGLPDAEKKCGRNFGMV